MKKKAQAGKLRNMTVEYIAPVIPPAIPAPPPLNDATPGVSPEGRRNAVRTDQEFVEVILA